MNEKTEKMPRYILDAILAARISKIAIDDTKNMFKTEVVIEGRKYRYILKQDDACWILSFADNSLNFGWLKQFDVAICHSMHLNQMIKDHLPGHLANCFPATMNAIDDTIKKGIDEFGADDLYEILHEAITPPDLDDE